MIIRQVFSEYQITMILAALEEKEKRLRTSAETTRNAGYGKATTLAKAEQLVCRADDHHELISYISANWD